jgi:copper homeostasis protein (lipoprotein)
MSRGEAPAAGAEADSPLGALPATFRGVLPCADCPGIEHHLDVYADGTYALRLVYQDRPESESVFDDIGRWSVSQGRPALVLRGGREGAVQFALLEDGGLRLLDLEGQPIESDLNYTLTRTPAFAPIEPRLALRGLYSYMADAGVFRECLTGNALPVAQEGDNAALERAYSDARVGPNEPVLASVEGRIAERVPMEGAARPTLIVERFIGVWPGEHCPQPVVDWSLTDTYWRLTQLNGAPVVVPAHSREPHIVLHTAESRVGGSGGCNRLMGGYVLEGEKLTFTRMASTMMACPEGMEQERAFAGALGMARTFRLIGAQLELYDEADKIIARFEATALK